MTTSNSNDRKSTLNRLGSIVDEAKRIWPLITFLGAAIGAVIGYRFAIDEINLRIAKADSRIESSLESAKSVFDKYTSRSQEAVEEQIQNTSTERARILVETFSIEKLEPLREKVSDIKTELFKEMSIQVSAARIEINGNMNYRVSELVSSKTDSAVERATRETKEAADQARSAAQEAQANFEDLDQRMNQALHESNSALEKAQLVSRAAQQKLDAMNPEGIMAAAITVETFESRVGAVESRLARVVVSPGTIVAFGGKTAPVGWLVCDGRAFNSTALFDSNGNALHGDWDLRDLRDELKTIWGDGRRADGARVEGATANLPDLRGLFLRGSGSRADELQAESPTSVGDTQSDQLKSHRHLQLTPILRGPVDYSNHFANAMRTVRDSIGGSLASIGTVSSIQQGHCEFSTMPTTAEGGRETRPRNASVTWIIKY